MAKEKPQPLTAAEIAFAKDANAWIGSRKAFALPSDRAGIEFTTKNLGDVCDQYLYGHSGKITPFSKPVDRDQLVLLLRRYRALKASQSRLKGKKRKLRALAKRLSILGDTLFKEPARLRRMASAAREKELERQQGLLF